MNFRAQPAARPAEAVIGRLAAALLSSFAAGPRPRAGAPARRWNRRRRQPVQLTAGIRVGLHRGQQPVAPSCCVGRWTMPRWLGRRAGAELCGRLAMPVSCSSLLRPVDLLPDREAATVAGWLPTQRRWRWCAGPSRRLCRGRGVRGGAGNSGHLPVGSVAQRAPGCGRFRQTMTRIPAGQPARFRSRVGSEICPPSWTSPSASRAGTCATGCPIATLRSCSPDAASRSTM